MSDLRHGQQGLTLVELIFSLLILAILAASGSRWLHQGFGAYYQARETTPLSVQGLGAMERISRELREAHNCASGGILIAGTSLRFTNTGGAVRIDQAGTPANAIFLNGQLLTSDVRSGSLLFQADPMASGDPCLVRVGFLMEKATPGVPPIRLPLRSAVQIRNRAP